ncbi:hypothetical protein TURU_153401 [Turdus rufiventris]|nr:hypothetical protein TURU_153401 [Turdus rufiventris]
MERPEGSDILFCHTLQQDSAPLNAVKLGFFSLENKRFWGDLIVAFQNLKGDDKKDGMRLFTRAGGNGLTLTERRGRLDIGKKFAPAEALAQGAQRSCGCPWIPGSVQGQFRWILEQPGIVGGVPAHGRGGTR